MKYSARNAPSYFLLLCVFAVVVVVVLGWGVTKICFKYFNFVGIIFAEVSLFPLFLFLFCFCFVFCCLIYC